jgi:pectate lyase
MYSVLFLVTTLVTCPPFAAAAASKNFGADTPGGAGGQTITVTNLNADGPGSFAAAVATAGPREVVFDVAGVIDLNRTSLQIKEPYLTVAGETAPRPGITFIRGGIRVGAHDVILRHIRVRPGEAGAEKKSGWEVDGVATSSHDILIDHCSVSWAIDENISASGPRFNGANVEEWRKNTSHRVTIRNCIIAEGLHDSTHGKGPHSKGSLIHDNATDIAIVGNLYAHNHNRNPFFKGGVRGVVVNNYIYNPGSAAVHYALVEREWEGREYVTGKMAIVGNVFEYGPDTNKGVPFFLFERDGPLEAYLHDNIARDREGKPVAKTRARRDGFREVEEPPLWPAGLEAKAADTVKEYVLKHAGARPDDRDAVDKRIIREIREGKGRIIDSEQEVGGYPE